jgi:acyl carrier protein
MGLSPIDPASAMDALDGLMQSGQAEAAVFPVDWAAYLGQFAPGTEPALTAVLADEWRSRARADEMDGARQQLLERLEAATPVERTEMLEDLLQRHVTDVLGFTSAQAFDPSAGFTEIGMDSVMAVELQHRIQRSLGVSLPATALFDKPNIQMLARHLLEHVLKLEAGQQPAARNASTAVKTAAAAPDLDGMSEEELVALLSKEVDGSAGAVDPPQGRRR